MYVNGKFATTVEKEISNLEISNLKVSFKAAFPWKYQDTTTFRLKFIGTESKAVIAGMIAAACEVPAGVIIGGIGAIVGVAGFCSFKQDFYKHVSASRNYKFVLKIYSDRNWGEYEGSITHYAVV